MNMPSAREPSKDAPCLRVLQKCESIRGLQGPLFAMFRETPKCPGPSNANPNLDGFYKVRIACVSALQLQSGVRGGENIPESHHQGMCRSIA